MGDDSPFAPLFGSADRFAAAAGKYLDGMQTAGPAAAEAARVFGDFLRVETMDLFQFPWSGASNPGGGAGATPPPPLQDSPAIGPSREYQLRGQRSADTGQRLGDAQHRLQLLWSDALRDAALAFVARVAPPYPNAAQGSARGIEVLRALYDSWIDCAEEAYARMAHSDSFSGALADFLNASSAWRKESQASVELWAKALDLPTRSELNTLMRRVNSLEEQLLLKEPRDPPPTDPPRAYWSPRARRGKHP